MAVSVGVCGLCTYMLVLVKGCIRASGRGGVETRSSGIVSRFVRREREVYPG